MTQVSPELQKRLDQIAEIWCEVHRDPDQDAEKVLLAACAKTKEVSATMNEELHVELETYAQALKEKMEELAAQQLELLGRQRVVRSLCRHNDDPDNESCYYCGAARTPYWAE